jgi:protein SCO1/2
MVNRMRLRYFLLFCVGLLIALSAVTAFSLNRPHQFGGSFFEEPIKAPEFDLVNYDGRHFRLADHTGQVILLFFGYTSCPDVCPVTLSDFKTIKTQIGERADRVSFVFITVDPERDNPERLENYLSNFDEDFIGLTGTRTALEPVWSDYGVYQEPVESGSSAGYLVDHSSRLYAIDQGGNLRVTYLFGTDPQVIADDVIHLLKQEG